MLKENKTPWIVLALGVFLCINLPSAAVSPVRSFVIGGASIGWKGAFSLKDKLFLGARAPVISQATLNHMEELKRENELLSMQLDHLRQWLVNEDRVEEQLQRLQKLDEKGEDLSPFLQRRKEEIRSILLLKSFSLPAKVVYREPCSWSSFLWINVGSRQNKNLGCIVVAKNSPVVVGNTLIGVVEEVEESKAKVRLVTDHRLVPAVRCVRGKKQNHLLLQQIENLVETVQRRPDLFSSEEESFMALKKIHEMASKVQEEVYLAKGELYGSSLPLWRSKGDLLKGVGFNYDFADAEGPARDLHSGAGAGTNPISILEEGDLLVTSGLDGIFPRGLEVALVQRVSCLQEGAISYQIKAKSLVQNLNEVEVVTVLPPLETLTLP